MDKFIVAAMDELSNERKSIIVYGKKWAKEAQTIVLDNGYDCVTCKPQPTEREVLEEQIRW